MTSLVFNIRPAAASDIRNLSAHELHRAPDGNSAIDPARSHLNRVLLGPRTQSEALDALFAAGVQRPATQAEAPYVQIVIGASAEFFRPDDPEAAGTFQSGRVEQFEREAMTWLKATFGDDLIHAATHLDEITPHMHVLIAPTYQKAARKPGRKKRGETDEAFEARKREAAERPTMRTVGRRSNALLAAPMSFQHLRQSLADHLAPLGIGYGNDLHPTDPDPQTTRQKLKSENDYLRAWNAYEQEQAAEAQRAAQEDRKRHDDLNRREEALAAREAALKRREADAEQQAEWLARGADNLRLAMNMAVSGQHDRDIAAADMADAPEKFEALRRSAPEGRPTLGWRARFWSLHYSDNGEPVAERHLPAKIRTALSKAFDRVAAWAKDIAVQAEKLAAREQKVVQMEQAADSLLLEARTEATEIVRQAHRDAESYGYLAETLETIRQTPQGMQQLALNYEAYQEVTQMALRRLGVAEKRIDLFGDYQHADPPPVLELVMDMAQRRAKEKVNALAARLRPSPGPGR